ncbi:Slam-dependent surface lipoprotein [Pseudomonas sp. LF245]
MKKLFMFTALALATSTSFAAVTGGSSTTYVSVGPSNLQGAGEVGIAMPTVVGGTADSSKIVSFKSGPIAQTNALIPTAGTTSAHIVMNNVKISETWKSSVAYGTQVYSYRQISDPLPNFPQFGGEVIAKVPGVEVYFGEWAPRKTGVQPDNSTDLNLTSANRTVFYAGENATTAMPTLVNAKYDVVGIKRFDPSAPSVSSGTLTANYGGSSGTLAGSIAGGAGTVNFTGTNIASNGSFQNASGYIKGQFYGSGAEALAGIYNNGTASASVAFGGKKQ